MVIMINAVFDLLSVMLATVILLLIGAPILGWYFLLRKFRNLDGIPGPAPLPIIGNSLDIGTTPQDLFNNSWRFYEQYGEVFKLFIGNQVRVFIANAEFYEKIMNSNVHITKSDGYHLLKSWINLGLLTSTGNKWKVRRKMITPSFHFKILDKFLEVFNLNNNVLVQKLAQEAGKKSFDFYPYVNLFSLDIICETSMGVKVASQEGKNQIYVKAIRDYLDIFIVRFFSFWERFDTLFRFSPKYSLHIKSVKILQDFSDEVIAKRRAEKVKESEETTASEFGIRKKVALLDMLLESEEAYNLSHDDIKEEINTFLFEGHETTTSAICFSVLALADHPDIQDNVFEEIAAVVGEEEYVTMQHLQDTRYLDMVLKEVHRMYPPVPLIERRLESNFNICGTDFPKGTNLILYLHAIHQNEKYFPNPHIFDPNRFQPEKQSERHNYAYVPFSAGPRNCIGQKFAWLDIKTAVIKIFQKFRVFSVPNYKPELGMAAVLKSYNGIWVRLEPRC